MKLILSNPFFGVVVESTQLNENDPDHSTRMKALRTSEIER
jgi:hypothetical protein